MQWTENVKEVTDFPRDFPRQVCGPFPGQSHPSAKTLKNCRGKTPRNYATDTLGFASGSEPGNYLCTPLTCSFKPGQDYSQHSRARGRSGFSRTGIIARFKWGLTDENMQTFSPHTNVCQFSIRLKIQNCFVSEVVCQVLLSSMFLNDQVGRT